MDTTKVYVPLRAQLWQVVVMISVLLFGAGAWLGLVWRQQRVRFCPEGLIPGYANPEVRPTTRPPAKTCCQNLLAQFCPSADAAAGLSTRNPQSNAVARWPHWLAASGGALATARLTPTVDCWDYPALLPPGPADPIKQLA